MTFKYVLVSSCKYKMNGGFLTDGRRYFLVYKLSHLASTFLRPSSPKCIENKSATAVAAISCWPGAGLGDKLFLQDILGFCRCGFVQQPAQSRHPAIPPVGQQSPTTSNRRQRQPTNEATNNQQPTTSRSGALQPGAAVRKLCLITRTWTARFEINRQASHK